MIEIRRRGFTLPTLTRYRIGQGGERPVLVIKIT